MNFGGMEPVLIIKLTICFQGMRWLWIMDQPIPFPNQTKTTRNKKVMFHPIPQARNFEFLLPFRDSIALEILNRKLEVEIRQVTDLQMVCYPSNYSKKKVYFHQMTLFLHCYSRAGYLVDSWHSNYLYHPKNLY